MRRSLPLNFGGVFFVPLVRACGLIRICRARSHRSSLRDRSCRLRDGYAIRSARIDSSDARCFSSMSGGRRTPHAASACVIRNSSWTIIRFRNSISAAFRFSWDPVETAALHRRCVPVVFRQPVTRDQRGAHRQRRHASRRRVPWRSRLQAWRTLGIGYPKRARRARRVSHCRGAHFEVPYHLITRYRESPYRAGSSVRFWYRNERTS